MTEPAPTRGRTAPGRLRALDAYLARCERALLRRVDEGVFLDVGLGDEPWTTLESAAELRKVAQGLRVVGIDVDEARVQTARAHQGPGLAFRRAGFEAPLEAGEKALVVRAMNVLRGYPQELTGAAHEALGGALVEGGLLVEGSSDREGGITCAHLVRRGGGRLTREALLFHTDSSKGFAPILFRDWLPRDLRRRVKRGEFIHALLADWTQAWEQVRAEGPLSPAAAFTASVKQLALAREGVCLEPWLVENGYLLFLPAAGIPP